MTTFLFHILFVFNNLRRIVKTCSADAATTDNNF